MVESTLGVVLNARTMNQPPHSSATLLRLPVALAVFFLLALSSCTQNDAALGSSFSKGLQRDAWKTMESYNQALLTHQEKVRSEIPPAYWEKSIQLLHPARVYIHRVNLVVVQQVQNGLEKGKYIYLPVSWSAPKSNWLFGKREDGFVFYPALGWGVYNFSRTTAQ